MKNNKTNKTNNNRHGFTIVELLVVIVVIGVLAAITVISYTGITQKATSASLQSDLTNASKKLKLDQVILGTYPANLAAANEGKGLTPSSDTFYQYATGNPVSLQTFCLAATKGD